MSKNCTIENNVVYNNGGSGIAQFDNSTIRNNILIADYPLNSLNTCIVTNNVVKGDAISSYPDNIYGATMANTFIDDVSADRYLLRDDSIAKGQATDGGDCGAFGGTTPYVLSGIPVNMPHFVNVSIPSSPTDGKLNIKLKIATQNE